MTMTLNRGEAIMTEKQRPESLEGRWDILYRDYPEVYEEWGRIPKVPSFLDVVIERFRFSLKEKVVVDVGSGTGLSTLALAQDAEFLIGIEPQDSMIAIAMANAKEQGVTNVRFEVGMAEDLPLDDDSVDAAIGFTLGAGDTKKAASEMERVVRPGGFVLRGDVAPGWYGGELNPIITGKPRNETAPEGSRDAILASLGYEAMDIFMDQDYGTVERAVRTYGFIHSKRAIDYIREHNVTSIRWKARARFKTVT
jgi:ubiquinone/menaquinone biosynthesis C-methylase UbiE